MWRWIKQALSPREEQPFHLGEDAQERGEAPAQGVVQENVKKPQRPFVLTGEYESTKRSLEAVFVKEQNADFILREFYTGKKRGFLAFMEGMVDRTVIYEAMLYPLMRVPCHSLSHALSRVLPIHDAKIQTQPELAVQGILDGMVLLVLDGEEAYILLECRRLEKRSVTTPQNEKVLRGPQQGYVEDLRTNLNLIRNLCRTPDLCTKYQQMGGNNNLKCAVLYRAGVVNPRLLAEVERRLGRAQKDKGFFMGDGMLERYLDTRRGSLFPQVLHTERPDRTAAFLMQGHVAILCEGSPFAILAPVTFFALLHTSEDHFVRPQIATLSRCVRLISAMLTLLLPALYIALMTFHQVVLPTEFMISTLTLRKMVGMPVVAEVLLMSFLFELVREVSIRVQGGINQSLGTIAGIVLGEALVSANIVSPIVLIIVTLTGLCSYAIPDYSLQMAVYLLRFAFLALAAVAGLVGMAVGWVVMISYLCTLESMGVPFFAPVAPATRHAGDLIIRRRSRQTDMPDDVNAQGGRAQEEGQA